MLSLVIKVKDDVLQSVTQPYLCMALVRRINFQILGVKGIIQLHTFSC